MGIDAAARLKRLTVIALFSDDELVDRLVLKGGNALSLAYNSTARSSFDLDFSMEGRFNDADLPDLAHRIESRLKQAFAPETLEVFDVKLTPKPENLTADLEDFWGGYSLEFRLITWQRYHELRGDLAAVRREAIPARPGGTTRFEVDISCHECCRGKVAIEIDDFTVYVYTPTMIVCEKIRAICQQTPSYVQYVRKHAAVRARDFFDIHETIRQFDIDVLEENVLALLRAMFQAKRVPFDALRGLDGQREFHRQDWISVRDTVDPRIQLRKFDYYFYFVLDLCRQLANALSS
ncbi:MAG: nucleotidyl transferase AbiEii/AbiGii toxin family protein [Planctomycetes bacterium]|nr:nucleotidyl transferase AbiEii/AbiGii toxin family protein [Planctomycetota bacterium]